MCWLMTCASKHLILFDVQFGLELYLTPEQKAVEAARLGIDVVPVLTYGRSKACEIFNDCSNHVYLGGSKVEGLVVELQPVHTRKEKLHWQICE